MLLCPDITSGFPGFGSSGLNVFIRIFGAFFNVLFRLRVKEEHFDGSDYLEDKDSQYDETAAGRQVFNSVHTLGTAAECNHDAGDESDGDTPDYFLPESRLFIVAGAFRTEGRNRG